MWFEKFLVRWFAGDQTPFVAEWRDSRGVSGKKNNPSLLKGSHKYISWNLFL